MFSSPPSAVSLESQRDERVCQNERDSTFIPSWQHHFQLRAFVPVFFYPPLVPMPPNSRIFDPSLQFPIQSTTTEKPVDGDSIVLRRIDVHEIMLRWFSHLLNVTEYFAHQVENDLWMHVAFQAQQEQVTIAVTTGATDYLCQRVFEDVVKVQGMKDRTVYMWSKVNQSIKAKLEPRIHYGHWKVSDDRSSLSPTAFPSFFLESGPFRAVCVNNESLMRIAELDFYMNDHDGFPVTGFQKLLPFLEKNSVVHRERLIVFVTDDERMCRKISERLICVTSPLFASLCDNFPLLHLALAKDHYGYVYLFIPACKTLVIVDPENLRFCETKVFFGNDWTVEETANTMMNLVSIVERTVTIGIPTLNIDSNTGFQQIVGYNIWIGVIPTRLNWHYSDQYPKGIEDNDSEYSTATSGSWNLEIPEFVTYKPDESISCQTPIVANTAEVLADELNPSMTSELDLLRKENEKLKNSLNSQKEIVEKLRRRNDELASDKRKLATEYEAKIERLKNDIVKARNTGEIKERSIDDVFDGERLSSENSEDHVPSPLMGERKRRVNVAMRSSAAISHTRSALSSPSIISSLHSLVRTPTGKLCEGENFTVR